MSVFDKTVDVIHRALVDAWGSGDPPTREDAEVLTRRFVDLAIEAIREGE